MTYAFDSNIVVYMLKDNDDVIMRYRQEADHGNSFVIPPVVYYEVQRWLLAKKLSKKRVFFERLCKNTEQVEFYHPVWQKAVQIYVSLCQQGKLIEDADIFIAAFCLVNDYTLVTNNIRHFERIDGLRLANWKE